jgi:signal transduction histidine kinase
MNLCTNAVQAMDEGGTIEVTVSKERIKELTKVRTGEIAPGDTCASR